MNTNQNPVKSNSRRKPLTIAAIAAAALMAVGGSAYAASVSTDTQADLRSAGSAPAASQHAEHDDDDDDRGDHDSQEDQQHESSKAPLASSDVTAVHQAADQAVAHTNAKGVRSIEIEHGGYEVEVQLSDGSEQDVFVAADGRITTSKAEKDDDHEQAETLLDLTKLQAVVDAARDALKDQNSQFDSISSNDDSDSAYEVEFTSGNDDVEVELNAALKVMDSED